MTSSRSSRPASRPASRASPVRIGLDLIRSHDDPAYFNDRFLGGPAFDPDPATRQFQHEICESVVRYHTTVVYSGNMLGKDFVFARLILWWLYTRLDSLVIVTAPTQNQVGSICWKEVRRAARGLRDLPPARITSAVQASPQQVNLGVGWQALGFATKSVERASGQHAGSLLVLVIEGSGIEPEIWEAIDSLGADRIAVNGNPIRADGRFVELIRQADKDRAEGIPPHLAVNAIRVKSSESPHARLDRSPVGLADATWLATQYRRYGRQSLWVRSHIEAEIPSVSADTLIPEPWLDFAAAVVRRPDAPNAPVHATRRIACDLGEGVGRASSCVLVRDDLGVLDVTAGASLGLAEAARIIWEKKIAYAVPDERITYDQLGIGSRFPSYLAKHGILRAVPYAGEARPLDDRFTNLRTEAAWKLRDRLDVTLSPDVRQPQKLQQPFSIPPREYWPRLREELKALTYSLAGRKTKLISKEDWCTVLGHSPDIADALIQSMAFA